MVDGPPDAGRSPGSGIVMLGLPRREIAEILGLPSHEIAEILGLPSHEIAEILGLPRREIAEILGLPGREIAEILGLPRREIAEILGLPSHESGMCFVAKRHSVALRHGHDEQADADHHEHKTWPQLRELGRFRYVAHCVPLPFSCVSEDGNKLGIVSNVG